MGVGVGSSQVVSAAPSSSHPAPAWGVSHGRQSFTNFSNVSPSHRLQFFTNCSSVGPFPWAAVLQAQPAPAQASPGVPAMLGASTPCSGVGSSLPGLQVGLCSPGGCPPWAGGTQPAAWSPHGLGGQPLLPRSSSPPSSLTSVPAEGFLSHPNPLLPAGSPLHSALPEARPPSRTGSAWASAGAGSHPRKLPPALSSSRPCGP